MVIEIVKDPKDLGPMSKESDTLLTWVGSSYWVRTDLKTARKLDKLIDKACKGSIDACVELLEYGRDAGGD